MKKSETSTRSLEYYWGHVAKNIEKTYQKGNPYDWNKKKMDPFIIHFQHQITLQVERNKSLVDSLRLRTEKDTIDYGRLGIPTYTTFWRIFSDRKGNGDSYTQLLFAVYFGYPSVDAYVEAYQLRKKNEMPPLPPFLSVKKHETPYLGLQTFALEHAALFYGRNNEINNLIEYLSQEEINNISTKDLIYLYGQSGVGKSSFLHSGIIPRMIEEWDIHYSRRDSELGLAKSFELTIKEKTTLLLIDNLHDLFEEEDATIKKELIDLFTHILNDLNQKSSRPIKIVLAIPPRHLNFVHDLISQSDIQKFSISLSRENPTIEENTYVKEIIKAALTINNQLIMISSFGEKHNLWPMFYQQIGFDFTFRYVYGIKGKKLSDLFITAREKRKELIILDQLEEAITKAKKTQTPDQELNGKNRELTLLSQNVHDYLKKRNDVKVILSFRADHYIEIERHLDENLSSMYHKSLLSPLNSDGVKQAIEGPLKDDYFELRLYKDFTKDMISLLSDDDESNIAPALQIILRKLWDLVKSKDRNITKNIFDSHVKKEKKIILSFLKQQLVRLEKNNLS